MMAKRVKGTENFDRTFAEYEAGFGDINSKEGEFWIGKTFSRSTFLGNTITIKRRKNVNLHCLQSDCLSGLSLDLAIRNISRF